MPGTPNKAVDFLIVGQSKQAFDNDITLLQKAGYKNVQFADSAADARNLLTSTPVNFVIAELEMQHMNGIEFLKLIRRHPYLMATPFLLISKINQREMVKYALEELADGYLLAPYSGEEFLCAVIRVQLKLSSLSNLQIKLRNARHLFLKREYDKSIGMVNDILKVDPDNIDALLILSECLYRKREIESSRKYIHRILKSQPHQSKALHLLSKICRIDADCGDAFNHLTAAHRQNPLNVDVHIDLGKFYLETGMDDKADEVFKEVLNSNPTDLCLIKIGKALLKKNRLHDAAVYLDKTVNPLPDTAYVFKTYAEMLEKTGNTDASLEQQKKCVLIAPDNPEYTIMYAESLKRSGHTAEAMGILNEFLKFNPDNETVKSMVEAL